MNANDSPQVDTPVVDAASGASPRPALDPTSAPAPALPRHELPRASLGTVTLAQDAPEFDAGVGNTAVAPVGVSELDALVNLVGELVLTRNQLLQSVALAQNGAANTVTQRLDLVTSELQEGLMRLRMQPIGSAWNELSAHARAFAIEHGKRTRAKLDGVDIELDRVVLDGLRAPLRGLLDALIEHSIESPDDRARGGKPPDALIALRAFQENGRVIIDVSDDGRGLDLSDSVVQSLLRPVQDAITSLGATCALRQRSDGGAKARIAVPLTLAITPALLVSSGGERFAIPQANLVELVRIAKEDARQIEHFAGGSMYRLRESLLPVVELRDALALAPYEGAEREAVPLVVIQLGRERFGLVVDEIHDTEEIVVKALDPQLQRLQLFTGATVLGDGEVALILDVVGVARDAGLGIEDDSPAEPRTPAETETHSRSSWLIFELPGERRMAAPLSRVHRLEEFAANSIERSGDGRVIQYRSEILPLFETSAEFGIAPTAAAQSDDDARPLSVVVVGLGDDQIGLLVERVVDILECEPSSERPHPRAGVSASAIIAGAVTDIIDLDWVAGRAGIECGSVHEEGAHAAADEVPAVRQLCTFSVGSLQLAADVSNVQEILRTPRMTRAPRTGPEIGGLINLRGQTVLCVDLCEFFTPGAARAEGSGAMTVVFNSPRGVFAARVDSVGDVIDVDPSRIEAALRSGQGDANRVVREIYKLPESLLLVLDVDRLIETPAPHDELRATR